MLSKVLFLCSFDFTKYFSNFLIVPVLTLMQFYDSRPPVLWRKWPLASSLLQAIKTCRQACPPGYVLHFSLGWIPESLVNNNAKLTKLLKVCWKHVLFILFRRSNFQQMLINFVNFELLFTKLSGIHPYEKCIT